MTEPHFYAWVRVGDGNPEPAAITGEKGSRRATTIGCPDAFNIDASGCPCQLLYLGSDGFVEEAEIEAPDDLVGYVEAKKAEQRWRAYQKQFEHSYAGFGR